MAKRTWIFTLNNYTETEVSAIQKWTPEVKRMLVSKEVGENNTPHLQGAITFVRTYRLAALKKLLARAHWEVAKAKDCFIYCAKDTSEVIVDVNNRKQGSRSDLEEIKQEILDGASDQQLWMNHWGTMVRCHRGIAKGRKMIKRKKYSARFALASFPWEACSELVTIVYGSSGIGKTQFAKAHFECALFVSHMDQLGEFDPEVHDGIVFDDMDFKHLPRSAQIHLVDSDEDRAIHIRYGTASIPAGTKKIFTTNEPDGEIFAIDDPAIARRITIKYVEEFEF